MRRGDALWGPIAITADVVRSITKYPRELVLGLAVLPALWGLPFIFIWKYTDEPHADIRASATSVAVYLILVVIRAAWSAVLKGGTVRIALTATDGARPDLRDLVRGVFAGVLGLITAGIGLGFALHFDEAKLTVTADSIPTPTPSP